MTTQPSHDEALEDFQAFVHKSVAGDPMPPVIDESFVSNETLAKFAFLFDIRMIMAAIVLLLALLFAVFTFSSRMDAQHYQSVLSEHRYSMGSSSAYWWRYDGLDNNMFDRRRHLSWRDIEHLRHTGLHVTYEEYKAHQFFRSLKLTSGILFVIVILLTALFGWRRLNGDAGLFDKSDDDSTDMPPAAALPGAGRPVFGRRS